MTSAGYIDYGTFCIDFVKISEQLYHLRAQTIHRDLQEMRHVLYYCSRLKGLNRIGWKVSGTDIPIFLSLCSQEISVITFSLPVCPPSHLITLSLPLCLY